MGEKDPTVFENPSDWVRTAFQRIWEKIFDNIINLIVAVIVTNLLYWGLYMMDLIYQPAKRITVAQQNKLGAYCLNTYFDSVEADGARLVFEPPQLRNAMICGIPPLTKKSKDRDALADVFSKLGKCFNAKSTDPQKWNWKVKGEMNGDLSSPAIADKVTRVTVSDSDPLFACGCQPAQISMLAENAVGQFWCGLDLKRAEQVLTQFRDVRVNW